MFFKKLFSRLVLYAPFPMTIGKIGIKLVKLGRNLQTKYANWSNDFRLKVEFHPNENCASLHISDPLITDYILTFESPTWQEKKKIPLVDQLFAIRGIKKVTLTRYEVSLMKGNVFEWNEIIPEAERLTLEYVTKKK